MSDVPQKMGVSDQRGNRILTLDRPFYWLLSDLTVSSSQRRHMGSVQQRFGILRQTYDLYDPMGVPFAQIQSKLLNFWHFSILDNEQNEVGSITKRWGGVLKEFFTDSDSFLIDFGPKRWNPVQRAIIFAAALSIDLDFFENNSPFNVRNLLTRFPLKLKPPMFTFRD